MAPLYGTNNEMGTDTGPLVPNTVAVGFAPQVNPGSAAPVFTKLLLVSPGQDAFATFRFNGIEMIAGYPTYFEASGGFTKGLNPKANESPRAKYVVFCAGFAGF